MLNNILKRQLPLFHQPALGVVMKLVKISLIVIVVILVTIGVLVVGVGMYAEHKISEDDVAASGYINSTLPHILETWNVDEFLKYAPSGTFILSDPITSKANTTPDTQQLLNNLTSASGNKEVLRAAFSNASKQLGAMKKQQPLKCINTFGTIMCFSLSSFSKFERGNASVIAFLIPKEKNSYIIEAISITPVLESTNDKNATQNPDK